MKKINSFRGEYRWLSNFADGEVEIAGFTFPSREAAFQALKTIRRSDAEKFLHVTPKEAKRLGRQIELIPGWETIKYHNMEEVCRAYFDQHDDMRTKLIETVDFYLEEGNQWCDIDWGCCYCTIHNGEGQNNLGKILMKIRDEYIKGEGENDGI